MKSKLMNKNGISIVEIVVTAVVFSIASFGIYSTISSSIPRSQESNQKLEAAYIGKAALEDLRNRLGANNWGAGSDFAVGPLHTYTPTTPGYTVTYTVVPDPSYPDAFRLDLNVTY